jgi:hypothetical protein
MLILGGAVLLGAPELTGSLVGRQVFPPTNWWNLDISHAPLDPASASFIEFIGRTRQMHPDFGPPPYGIPYVVVTGDQPLVIPTWTAYGDESDAGAAGRPPGYPIPRRVPTLPVSRSFRGWFVTTKHSGPGEITHAFRVTVRETNGYVWPASHRAGATAGALPMGARLRLKSTKNLSAYTLEVQRIFRALQRYGLIVADNGSDMYMSGTMDPRWNNDVLNPAFHGLSADDFEVVQLGWRGGSPPSAPLNLRIVR